MQARSIPRGFPAFLVIAFITIVLAAAHPRALAEVSTQRIPGPNGELSTGPMNKTGMSRSGRYVLLPNHFNSHLGPQSDAQGSLAGIHVRDIKTQTTSLIFPSESYDWNFYSLSPNGRYLFFSAGGRQVFDQITQTSKILVGMTGDYARISDTGKVLYLRGTGSGVQVVLLDIHNDSEHIIVDTATSEATGAGIIDISAQGDVVLYSKNIGNTSSLYLYTTKDNVSKLFQPWRSGGIPIANPRVASLSACGQFVAIVDNPTNGSVYRVSLNEDPEHAEHFTVEESHAISILSSPLYHGLSISSGGRYISFEGGLEPGHPEFLLASAHGSPGYTRIFRYDTIEDRLVTTVQGYNMSPVLNINGFTAMVLGSHVISHDGSMVIVTTNAHNMTPAPTHIDGEANYHVYIHEGFSRNYLFIDLPNTDNNWQMFEPMTLVGDNQWEGHITFTAQTGNAFKFDAGGFWQDGEFIATPNWAINFGDSGVAGQAVASGGNIAVTEGPGRYKITFNDATLEYTVTRQVVEHQPDWQRTVIFIHGQTTPGQDMFVRGGIDHNYAQSVLGLDCTSGNYLCAVPIQYRNTLNPYTENWKVGDHYLDWYGRESGQSLINQNGHAEGTVLDWTTNNTGNSNTVDLNGLGFTPLNTWGDHYWMLDVDMDCSRTVDGWFELKSFISNGPGWESDVSQDDTPYISGNHFARCGYVNRFQRGSSSALIVPMP